MVEFQLLIPIRKNCGGKKLPFNPDIIKDVPLRQRHTIRDLASALHMSRSTLHKRLKEEKFRRHTNAIRFTLTGQNRKERVRFCTQMLDNHSLPDDPTFKSLYNVLDLGFFQPCRHCLKSHLR